MKKFFCIEKPYTFEIMDLFSVITVLNVVLVLVGLWWAPIIGLVNCALNILYSVKYRGHINSYVMQIALIVLNSYFLTLQGLTKQKRYGIIKKKRK